MRLWKRHDTHTHLSPFFKIQILLGLCCFFFIFLKLKYKMETNELWAFDEKKKEN